jgi:thioredoxin-dependent peroxiredoxin
MNVAISIRSVGRATNAKPLRATAAPARITCCACFAKDFVMVRFLACASLGVALCLPAHAALDIGEDAPDFTASAALGGAIYKFSLAESLKKGPVVLYFFPAAFSDGCSVEAHEFAEAIPRFAAFGASVVGVSGDDIDVLAKFSTQACQSRFPVAADPTLTVIKSYDAAMKTRPEYANRITYVIAPGGKIVYHYINLNPTRHVERALGALRSWSRGESDVKPK